VDAPLNPKFDPLPNDEIDPQELADIEQSEREIEAGQVVEWKELSAQLRAKYLGKPTA
jgi:hypothetical protein